MSKEPFFATPKRSAAPDDAKRQALLDEFVEAAKSLGVDVLSTSRRTVRLEGDSRAVEALRQRFDASFTIESDADDELRPLSSDS